MRTDGINFKKGVNAKWPKDIFSNVQQFVFFLNLELVWRSGQRYRNEKYQVQLYHVRWVIGLSRRGGQANS